MATEIKCDVNLKDDWGWSALHWAVFSNKPEIVEVLLASGAKITDIQGAKWSPLVCAIKLFQNILPLMVQCGALTRRNHEGWTPNILAIHEGYNLVEGLAKSGDYEFIMETKMILPVCGLCGKEVNRLTETQFLSVVPYNPVRLCFRCVMTTFEPNFGR